MNQQVAEAFKKLYFGKRTGVLTCEADAARRAVYFQSGFVVSASSSLEQDRLGEVMIRHGRITQQQFEDAAHFIKSGWKLGEILAELSVIDEEEIESFVRLQLLDIACTQLIRPPKRLSFAALSGVDAYLEAPLSVADILMEAARRTPKLGSKLRALKGEKRKLGFPSDPLKRFQDVNLQPEEAFVLSRVDGTQTPKDIFAVSPLSEEQTARTLLGLLEAQLIEPEGTDVVGPKVTEVEAAEPEDDVDTSQTLRRGEQRDRERASVERLYQEVQFQDHWQVLSIDRGASSEMIKEAFLAVRRPTIPTGFAILRSPSSKRSCRSSFNGSTRRTKRFLRTTPWSVTSRFERKKSSTPNPSRVPRRPHRGQRREGNQAMPPACSTAHIWRSIARTSGGASSSRAKPSTSHPIAPPTTTYSAWL